MPKIKKIGATKKMTLSYSALRLMQERQTATIRHEIAELEKLIAQKMQLLSGTRNREDRELIEVQIVDLQTHRRRLSSLLTKNRGESEESAGHISA